VERVGRYAQNPVCGTKSHLAPILSTNRAPWPRSVRKRPVNAFRSVIPGTPGPIVSCCARGPSPRPGILQHAFALAFVALGAACTSPGPASPTQEASDAWGPLAVKDGPPNGDFARMPGVLRLTDQCAMLELATGDLVLLAWPVNETAWRPETETVVYRRPSGDAVEARDGDAVVLTGSGEVFSGPESEGLTVDAWIARLDWVTAPDEDCTADLSWSIGDVSIGDE
jgi:hypothetical protein